MLKCTIFQLHNVACNIYLLYALTFMRCCSLSNCNNQPKKKLQKPSCCFIHLIHIINYQHDDLLLLLYGGWLVGSLASWLDGSVNYINIILFYVQPILNFNFWHVCLKASNKNCIKYVASWQCAPKQIGIILIILLKVFSNIFFKYFSGMTLQSKISKIYLNIEITLKSMLLKFLRKKICWRKSFSSVNLISGRSFIKSVSTLTNFLQ